MKVSRTRAIRPALLLAVSCVAVAAFADPPAADETKKSPRSRLTLSREVTFFTQPLAPDGLVDYAAALNDRYGKGVTPENNAAVALVRATGYDNLQEEQFVKMCRRLGIEVPRTDEDAFVDLYKFVEEVRSAFARDETAAAKRFGIGRDRLRKELERSDWSAIYERCKRAPWSTADEPLVAAWLERVAKPLDSVRKASEQTRFFVPYDSGAGTDGMLRSSAWFRAVRVASELRVRAMYRLGEAKALEAWSDALAFRRWGNLLAEGGMAIDQLVASHMHRTAATCAACILTSGSLTEQEFKKLEAEWSAVSNDSSLAASLGVTERCFVLDGMNSVVRAMPDSGFLEPPPRLSVRFKEARRSLLAQWATPLAIDWNAAYRGVNAVYDDLERIARMPDGKQRLTAAREYAARAERRGVPRNTWAMLFSIAALDFPARRAAMGQLISMTMTSKTIPVMAATIEVEQARRAEIALVPVVFALARHRTAHGEYPQKLDQLVPTYFDKPPQDEFSDGPLKYQRHGDGGFVLYSVGPNGKDDGGRSDQPLVDTTTAAADEAVDDDTDNADADDLVIRVGGTR